MKDYRILLALFGFLFLTSCTPEAQDVNYGKDQCNYCKMNIVDRAHAAQYVTNKGKQFKFDAIECMVNDLKEKGESGIAIMLVADFENPGIMVSAKEASFLISEKIKSPMGANLSAFSSKKSAEKTQAKQTGTVYTWMTLKNNL